MVETKLAIDPAAHAPADAYKLLIGAIVPRPIGFISTISPEGVYNLAPFSFFNAVCSEPPVVLFASGARRPEKDTLANVRATGEFVVNIVTEAIAEQMNLTSGDYPPEVDEFAIARLTPAASELVKPPCVLESPVNMECKVIQIVDVSTRPAGGSVVFGEVVRFHVDASMVQNFRIDPEKLRAIGRMGGTGYTRTRERFEMARPRLSS
ncbi:MAG: flavin reductase family protein [Bryobacterales bacterium]|nr:flavin reductase family protein [Bryobacterales bacterium]MBV9400122.1 flavin reductase family protein [Bryobacterales bacterium]